MMVWKMIFLFQGRILRFHVSLPGCTWLSNVKYIYSFTLPKTNILVVQIICRFFGGFPQKEESSFREVNPLMNPPTRVGVTGRYLMQDPNGVDGS